MLFFLRARRACPPPEKAKEKAKQTTALPFHSYNL